MNKPSEEHLADLARLLNDTEEQEIDCAEMLNRVGPYLEALSKRHTPDADLRTVAQHLKICPECREEFDLLLRAEGIDPDQLANDCLD